MKLIFNLIIHPYFTLRLIHWGCRYFNQLIKTGIVWGDMMQVPRDPTDFRAWVMTTPHKFVWTLIFDEEEKLRGESKTWRIQ